MRLFLISHGNKRAIELLAKGLRVLGAGVGSQTSPKFSPQSLGGRMNWKRFFAAVFALLVVLSLGSTRLIAQTQSTGDVTGVVSDPSGGVVPDAKVVLKDVSKGNNQETKTSKDGTYRFYLLTPGTYDVTVTATGFNTESRQVEVTLGQITSVNVKL